ncbi:MAG: trypsin-like peptidase domain-containing protein [Actinobacteria bacterium]|nr:trypsin-like peptidase domain-containing protein [Actinomycetota bacterium]
MAGVRQPTVQTPTGRRLRADVVVFDPNRDLAVLDVSGLGEDPLAVGTAHVGDTGAVFGHPGGQIDIDVSPARVAQRINALGRNLYDSQMTRRDVLLLSAHLMPGDSGGALVNTDGMVVGVAFAIAPDDPTTAYALNSTELNAALAAPRASGVDTGPCLD